jgi:uncharacterized metal-binding protein YceD (DUF177 family)
MTSTPSDAPRPRPSPKLAWSVPFAAADIPETGARIELEAEETVRQALAAFAGLTALPRLQARFEITKHGAGGMRVFGHVQAVVVQECVVTLEPVESKVEEIVELYFVPEAEKIVCLGGAEDSITVGSDDPPEILQDGKVDLGEIAVEFLLLGIDPYPRKAGAVFQPSQSGDARPNPFAALAALKKPGNNKSG